MRKLLALFSLAAAAAACGSNSTYIPEERATATLGGRTAAAYSLPSDRNKQGGLRLASYGVSELKQNEEDSLKAIHLRMAVSDNGTQPVTLDTREQRLQLPDGRQLAPAYATSRASAPPLIQITPGTARTVDLFFPLPPDIAEESNPSQFDIIWRVDVGSQTVSQITPFDQVSVDPAVARQELAEDIMDEDVYIVDPAWGPASIGTPGWGF
jgi:hypothetical protein